MKYTPRPLEPEAADISRGHDQHPLRELALLVAGLAAIAAVLYLIAVLVTDAMVSRVSLATEARLFSAFSAALPQPNSLPAELEQRKREADKLLARLHAQSGLAGLPVKLIVWDKSETNAAALPGGTIALTTGLLRCLDEEPGMAFVLAHELGHFRGRDHLRGLGRRLSFQVVTALVFSGQSDLQIGAAQAGHFAYLAHSRSREAAADRYALDLVHRTLGSEAGATRLFELLRGDRLPGWAYMFNTHPATEARIKSLQKQAAQLQSHDSSGSGTNHAAGDRPRLRTEAPTSGSGSGLEPEQP